MTWTPRATREDVIYLLVCFRAKNFDPRSMAGRIAIDDTRVSKRQDSKAEAPDIMSMSWPQILDAQRYGQIREAVTARPAEPIYTDHHGERLNRVAPLRDVASIVRGKSHRPTGNGGSSTRDWRATVNNLLGRIPRNEANVLLEVTDARQSLREERNKLQQAKSAVNRLKSGDRNARNLRRHAEDRVKEIQSKVRLLGDRLKAMAPTAAYRDGLDHLLEVCTRTEAVERDVFFWLDDVV